MIKALLFYMASLNMNLELPDINTEFLSHEEIMCTTLNIYHEAGNQDRSGKEAVANVTVNRINDSRYPDTPCTVVKQKNYRGVCHFSWYCLGGSLSPTFKDKEGNVNTLELNEYKESYTIAILALSGILKDNTNGATHYYNHNLVNPRWAKYYKKTIVYQDHTFLHRSLENPW